MRPFTREELAALIASHEPPCVTICLPTHRRLPEAAQDPIRFRNLLRDALAKLDETHDRRQPAIAEMVARLEELAGESAPAGRPADFWNHQKDGLAVFAAPAHFAYYRVAERLREITVVGDSFHVKPLLPVLVNHRHYDIVAVTQGDVRVYEGNRETIHELSRDGIPANLEEAIGSEWDDARDSVAFHGTRGHAGGAGEHFHGTGGAERAASAELGRFLRAVDRAVDERISRRSGHPLILAAVEAHHAPYREVSKNARLVPKGITADPKALSLDQLREAAWSVLEPIRDAHVAAALEEQGSAQARGAGSTDLAEIARAIVEGRVRTLLLEEKRRFWGHVDRETGKVAFDGSEETPGSVDLLDELAEMTLAKSGDVLLVSRDRMPNDSGLAATYRY